MMGNGMDFKAELPEELSDIAHTGAAIGIGNFQNGAVNVFSNYRQDWQDLYQKQAWIARDPIVGIGLACESKSPWPTVKETGSEVLRAAHDFGIQSGIIISNDIGGSKCVAGLSTNKYISEKTWAHAEYYVREMHLDHLTKKAGTLTAKQQEIAFLFAQGRKTKDICHMLGISISAVNQHKIGITSKIGVSSFVAALNICARAGITFHPTNQQTVFN